ncbi:hypothetical protein KSP40_PGU011744 [Platanthera guangdongensis]|uniref:Uncharacterized protein n=1 Tax=Platanthera guangdongensis TaxID=2320717 RepID=A0ABR2MDF3_9ASPA
MLPYVQSLVLEVVAEDMSFDRQQVILVFDTDVTFDDLTSCLQMLSWENLPIVKNQEVYRMSSLCSIQQKLDRGNYDQLEALI